MINNKPIRKVLIANRGEIACRIIHTLQHMGIASVAIYSTIDIKSLHVSLADEAYCVGEAPSQASYLQQERIISIANHANVDAIHPGYGFLSENAEFAKRCADHDIIFIGPSAKVIELMGDKHRAKDIMHKAHIPIIPGYQGEQQTIDELYIQGLQVGFPLMVKASAGGGGKGMRLVTEAAELKPALAGAKREAMASFGDDTLILEKYLSPARHIEVQIMGDHYNHVLYLFDRDCSIQRRHQKIIEEAPAPHIDTSIRQQMATTAINAAAAINYYGVGTVEFLFTPAGEFYFMEMNTRLQVEHPVTEMITGLDMVAWQIRIAQGDPLTISQEDIHCQGHAIEMRIYAEDPHHDFMPTAGKLEWLTFPKPSNSLRIDSGVQSGDEISVYYDSLLAKLIVWQESRELAIIQLRKHLANISIIGLTTNLGLLYRITQQPAFIKGGVPTEFIGAYQDILLVDPRTPPLVTLIAASLSCWRRQYLQNQQRLTRQQENNSPWLVMDGWEETVANGINMTFWHNDICYKTHLYIKDQGYIWQWQDHCHELQMNWYDDELELRVDHENYRLTPIITTTAILIFTQGTLFEFSWRYPHQQQNEDNTITGNLNAPMPGVITQICVSLESTVLTGEPLIIMEAMKMEHIIRAQYAGVVSGIFCQVGDRVKHHDTLIAVKKSE